MSIGLEKLTGALAALQAALRAIPAPSMIMGGVAVIFHGVGRLTADVDATIWAETLDIENLLRVLSKHEIHPRIADPLGFAQKNQILLLEHRPTETTLDLGLAWLPFEKEALDRSQQADLGGVKMAVASVEDLVIYKAVAWRDRDRSDIQRLLEQHFEAINLTRVRARLREFAMAIDEPERVDEFERLLQAAREALNDDDEE
jgi:hypothetical protein